METVEDLSHLWLWDNPYFPKCDWKYVEVEDLYDALHTCVACGREEIRYVHHIQHDCWGTIQVGCVCAGKLTGDDMLAKRVERNARNKTKRRETFIYKTKWKISQNDNYYLKKRKGDTRYLFVIFGTDVGWKCYVKEESPVDYIHDPSPYALRSVIPNRYAVEEYTSKETYSSLEKAKGSLFDRFLAGDMD